MFFDQAKIHVAAGNGGNGCVSFRREHHVPRGGPDGGDGGHGGDVVLYVDPQVRDLQLFTYKVHFKAGFGQGGMGAKKHGANGDTVRIPVPTGTQVWVIDAMGEGTPVLRGVIPGGRGQADRRPGTQGPGTGGSAGRRRRTRQHPLQELRASGSQVLRVGGGGRELLVAALAEAHGRRGLGRVAQRRQVLAAKTALQRQTQGGGLSVHHRGAHAGGRRLVGRR